MSVGGVGNEWGSPARNNVGEQKGEQLQRATMYLAYPSGILISIIYILFYSNVMYIYIHTNHNICDMWHVEIFFVQIIWYMSYISDISYLGWSWHNLAETWCFTKHLLHFEWWTENQNIVSNNCSVTLVWLGMTMTMNVMDPAEFHAPNQSFQGIEKAMNMQKRIGQKWNILWFFRKW